MTRRHLHILLLSMILIVMYSCSVDNYVPEGKYYLNKVKVVSNDEGVLKKYGLKDYVQQSSNRKIFGMRIPLSIYTLSGQDTTRWTTRVIRKLGEAPVLYDSIKSVRTENDINATLINAGYRHVTTEEGIRTKGKKANVTYYVNTGPRYFIRDIRRVVIDNNIRKVICGADTLSSLLHVDTPFDANLIAEERSRISKVMRDMGYYKFTKDDIRFVADTIQGSTNINLTIHIGWHVENGQSVPEPHRQYRIGNISFYSDTGLNSEGQDSMSYKTYDFFYDDKMPFRKNFLISNTHMIEGGLYNDSQFRSTFNGFNRLSAVSYSNIYMEERPGTDLLDTRIIVNHSKPYSIGADLEATNSAGDLGAAVSASLQHNNIFRGAETFTLKLRGAYEAITGLEGYQGNNYYELGAETKINFPAFLLPFVHQRWAAQRNVSSEISLQYNMQNRPEFQRHVFTAAWRYRWNTHNQRFQHKFDLLEINYVYMPWISQTFREQYLDSLGKTNAILKYNYENLLITKLGYTYTYNSLGTKEQTFGKNAYTLKFNIETSGNLLYGITTSLGSAKNENGQYIFCGIAYAQYVKGDIDYAKSIKIDNNNSLALHAALGIAYPYGNSSVLPFEKRYFSGGANSVRGWSVRSLGPGSYNGADKGINFINQSGDIKLDLSIEYRANLFWKLSGAAFIDAGNIWTIRKYEDQPGGEFRFDKFYEQIAVAYGIGLRINFGFFILRVDGGMKAINPAYTGRDHFPILSPSFKRDFAFHFAVGMPF